MKATATQADTTATPNGELRNLTDPAGKNAVWRKVCDLDDLMIPLEGAASAVAAIALWIKENDQNGPDYVGTGLLHAAHDIVNNHLPGIREWGGELANLARVFLPNDPLVALEHELGDAERLYGESATAADTGPAKGKAAAEAANKAMSARIDELLHQMADTPIVSIEGVAVAARCMVFLSEMGWADQHDALARSILAWAGARTGRDEMAGGVVTHRRMGVSHD